MAIGSTNRPYPFSDQELRASLSSLTFQSGDTSNPRLPNPNIIYPGMLVRIYPHQNRRNIIVEGIRAGANLQNLVGPDGTNTRGGFFTDQALPVHRRQGQLATGILEAVAAAELNDFARETTGGPTNYSAGLSVNFHTLPMFAVCVETTNNRNAAGQLVNAVLPGNDGNFVVKGNCNLTLNAGASTATSIGLVTNTAYAAGTAVFLDASDNYLPKLVPFNEAGTAIGGTQPALASPDIVVGYLSRRIDASEFTVAGVAPSVPVYFCGMWPGYERR